MTTTIKSGNKGYEEMKAFTVFAVVLSALPICTSAFGAPAASKEGTARAELHDAAGREVGTASVRQVGSRIRVRVDGANLPPGTHGVHVHQAGSCTAPDFSSAGPHWNPTNAQHGHRNPAGSHSGDLPNLVVGQNGRGTLEYTIAGARLTGGDTAMLDAKDGASIVIHSALDDYRTDPSGNSGARIACGVLR